MNQKGLYSLIIMPANNKSGIVHYFAGKYPGKIGLLLSPEGFDKGRPPFYMPYALDNGCFKRWDEKAFFFMLRKATLTHKPLWVVCPDVVSNHEDTLSLWHKYNPRIKEYGFNLAFACQDGCEPKDVPNDAFCCFIGGSTEYKLENAHKFKGVAEWLHVGRVNSKERIEWAESIGADSIDGTGFFRDKSDKKYAAFIGFFEGSKQKNIF
jgi:hypothetical protein